MDGPLLVLGFLQVVALLIYLWVGRVFISQPVTNHPGIFYNPTACLILCNGPAVTMVISVVLAFMFTNSPWLFLGFSLAGWIACSPRPGSNQTSTPHRNLYDVIELPQDAGQGLIEEQCIRLGERYRPDKNSSESRAAFMFAQVEKAYETLSDPVKRAAYDAELRSASIGLHSKINSWIALLFLLAVFKELSDVLSRIVASWLQANNFAGMTVATVGAIAGVAAAFIGTVIVGRLLGRHIPLWHPLSGILRTRGTAEITQGKRMLATVALLLLAPVVLVGGSIAVESQKKEAARVVAEETAKRSAEENARVLEAQARAAEERARIAEYQALVQQARVAEERARIAEEQALAQQARVADAQAAAYNQARARADAQQLARIESLRQQCEGARSAGNVKPGSLASFYGAQMNMKLCSGYDTYYQTPSRQRRVVDCNPRVQRCD